MQHRARRFDSEQFAATLDGLGSQDLQRLVDDYAREEALYREAKALRLDANDAIARKRLIQQLSYITGSLIDATTKLDDAAVEQYYLDHQALYREPAVVTFTHVFFGHQRHGVSEARALAESALVTLNDQRIPFHESMRHGERFLFHSNYVKKEADLVASHFSTTMQEALFALAPSDQQWRGPFESAYGSHVVMLTDHRDAYDPPLDEIRARVYQDAYQARRQQQLDQTLGSVVEGYRITLAPILEAQLALPVNPLAKQ